MTINEIKKQCLEILKQNNIKDSELKVKLIISKVLNVNKEYLITHNDEEVREELKKEIVFNTFKLLQGEPIQYIINNQAFFGLDFFVDKNVLIPQPDTEILVEEVISISQKYNKPDILDLCTGSGAIAIVLKKNIPEAIITATDISKNALKVAQINKEKNNTQIKLIKSNMFKKIKNTFNIIVSNPPYIKTKVIKTLDKEVQNEPIIALDGGQDGLKFYKTIIKQAYKYLKEDGFLCLEIGYDQKEEVMNLIKESNKYNNIYSKKDLSGNDRIIICNRK